MKPDKPKREWEKDWKQNELKNIVEFLELGPGEESYLNETVVGFISQLLEKQVEGIEKLEVVPEELLVGAEKDPIQAYELGRKDMKTLILDKLNQTE